MPLDVDFYKDLVDNLYDGVYFVDRDRVITYWNKGAERIAGYSSEQVIGRRCRDNLLNHVTASGTQLCLTNCPLAACMDDGHPREAEVFLQHSDGHRVPVLVRAAPVRDGEGNIVGAVESFSNNLRLVDARQKLRDLHANTQTDALTGVGNRAFVESLLNAVVAGFTPTQPPAGLLFIDLDDFKQVNDTYGHAEGDRALRHVAATLKRNLRASDEIGRWGGDEFLVVVTEVASGEALAVLAGKMLGLVRAPQPAAPAGSAGHTRVTLSLGATLLLPGDSAASLVRRADELMYQSKRAGGGCVTLG